MLFNNLHVIPIEQNYFIKMDLDGSVFLHEIFYVRLGSGDTKWHHHNTNGHKCRIFTDKYRPIQVHIFMR